VRLSDSPCYKALSYCWASEDGNDAKHSLLYCDGKLISVTENCEAALRNLRERNELVLWIDSTCINQADRTECGHQVGLMRSIYKNASSVLIYLGEPQPDTCEETGQPVAKIVTDFLRKFTLQMEVSTRTWSLEGFEKTSTYQEFSQKAHSAFINRYQDTPALIRGLQDITSRRWWQRVWVVQEASLLSRGTTILWGNTSIPYATLAWLYETGLETRDFPTQIALSPRNSGTNFWVVKYHLGNFRNAEPPTYEPRIALVVLDKVRNLKDSDPRDRVYGLLSLIDPENSIVLMQDYNKTTAEVFILVSRRLIEVSKTLDVLHYISEIGSSSSPSWVALESTQST